MTLNFNTLTRRELQVARLLQDAKGAFVATETIARRLFGDYQPVSTEINAVRILVKRVRDKLGAECIVTKQGFGYRWATYAECCPMCRQPLPKEVEYRYA